MNFLPQENTSSERHAIRHSIIVLGVFALLLSVLYEFLFIGKNLGLNIIIFFFIYTLGFILIYSAFHNIKRLWPLLLLLPIAVFVMDIFVYQNNLVQNLLPFIITLFLFFFSLFFTYTNAQQHAFSILGLKLIRNVNIFFLGTKTFVQEFTLPFSHYKKENVKKILVGFIVAFPILLLFLALLTNADPIFYEKINNAFLLMRWKNAGHVFRIIFFTLVFGTLLSVFMGSFNTLEEWKKSVKKLDEIVLGTIYLLINILFASFVFIQFRYLFGNALYVFQNGISFAEYARSGFFELMWVVFFSAVLLLVGFRSTSHHGSSVALKILKTLLAFQVIIIAYSALQRMNLYQSIFGYTVLRLYVEWFIYFMMVLLVCTVFSIVTNLSFKVFFYSNLIAGIVALSIVSSVNVDGMIAKKNIDRYLNEGKEIDIPYLASLSLDTVPFMIKLEERFPVCLNNYSLANGLFVCNSIFGDMYEKLQNEMQSGWMEFHWGKYKAEQYLQTVKELSIKESDFIKNSGVKK